MNEAMALAERMARRPSAAVRAIKRCVYQAASENFDTGMEIEKAEFISAATQAITRKAMVAYADYVSGLAASGAQLSIQGSQTWMDGTAVDFNR